MKVPSYINCDHLLSEQELHRITYTLPSSRDRYLMLSHNAVSTAIVKAVGEAISKEREEIAAWLDAQGGAYKVVAEHIRSGSTPNLDPIGVSAPAPMIPPKPWAVRRVDGSLAYFDTRSAARSAKNTGEVVLRCA